MLTTAKTLIASCDLVEPFIAMFTVRWEVLALDVCMMLKDSSDSTDY